VSATASEANKALVLSYFLASHNAPFDLDVIDEVCTPAYATQQREWHEMERAAFPDKHFDVEDVIAEGDMVVLRWHFRGTQQGSFWTPLGTVPATGRTLDLSATLIYRIENGKIAEVQVYVSDQYALDNFFNEVYSYKPIPDRLAE